MDNKDCIDSQNILQIIDSKLQTFRRKRQLLQEKISTQKDEVEQIKNNISELQLKLKSTSENIEKSTSLILEYEKIIDEMDLGYKNIIDSGQTLLSLVKLPIE